MGIIAGPIHLFINWLFGNYDKSCSSSDINEELSLEIKSKSKAKVTDVNNDDIEVKTSYEEISDLLTLELYNKSSKKLIDIYYLQLDPMLGNQTKIIKEIDGGNIKVIQAKSYNGFDLDIVVKDIDKKIG